MPKMGRKLLRGRWKGQRGRGIHKLKRALRNTGSFERNVKWGASPRMDHRDTLRLTEMSPFAISEQLIKNILANDAF